MPTTILQYKGRFSATNNIEFKPSYSAAPENQMKSYPVSYPVNNPENDGEELIKKTKQNQQDLFTQKTE